MTTESSPPSPSKNAEKHSIFLKNGTQVRVNDHVYCSPTWAVRDCTPYSVARIMEFLKPEGKTGPESESYHYTRVRLAWYYRPSDVSDRPVADSRLLLAAIYSEVCDINQIRAKCHVVHRDKITDLSGWKKRPDRFYFNKLFDPYIKREFEIIQASDVRNIPDDVRNTLLDRYEFVVAEKEVIPDLTDTIRLCESCTEWCPTPDSVQCDRCKRYFHMRCVNPPLLAKPSRGYGWTCAPCSRKHEEEVDSRDVRHTTPGDKRSLKSNAPAPRGRGRPRKDRTLAEKEENLPVKYFKMWPFRYFGQYTVAEDTLDPEDNIFPRTATRVGPKYQPNYPENGSANPGPDEERGEDKTIEVLSAVNDFTQAEMTQCLEQLQEVATTDAKRKSKNEEYFISPTSSVDFLTEVVRQFSDASLNGRSLSTVTLDMINSPRIEKWKVQPTKHYTDREWSKDEVAAFEDAIMTHGAELRAVREEIVVRSMPEVVRFYGHWKNKKIGEQNEQIRRDGPPPERIYPKFKVPGSNEHQVVGIHDDEESVITAPSRPPSCGACRTKESKGWWKAPRGLSTTFLCDTCGTNWRKYADLNVRPTREDSVPVVKQKTSEKREGTPLTAPPPKRTKRSSSTQSTPPPTSAPVIGPQFRCVACSRSGPLGKVLKCRKCELCIHAAVCGASFDIEHPEKWQCDLCTNDDTLEASVYHDCLLCPRVRYDDKLQSGPFPDSFLRACKPTEGQGWAHVICSVFVPEVTFTDHSTLKLVEGISAIPTRRWAQRCYLCQRTDGAVVKCTDCPKEYHVPCALAFGNVFGFEIQPVKGTRKDNHITTTFKGETGCMNAVMFCREHPHSRRRIYGLCETDDGGDSALQVYVREYKQAQIANTYGLLRKARRLDSLLHPRSDTPPAPDPALDNLECCQCHTQFSPAFYPSPSTPGASLCHSCHFTFLVPPQPVVTTNGTTDHGPTEVQVS
ncbi:hypothetical protein K435DRAFT_749271 [Dendrothele bispora CBS 962.96]|uniref:BAH-domain-containing protein n=1 Tax=Dendrothele bispora (strain CBS 962.96) TaxID=1314807 RepID=A0A4S8MII4_DENBC|nr:hypothetical protein K435DRAFT_749271 [Dendrothele bispora CBS 962.96]